MHSNNFLLSLLVSLLLLGATHAQNETENKSPSIERYLTDDSLGMVRINVDKFDINPWIDTLKKATADKLDERTDKELETFRAAAAGIQILAKGSGLRELYLVLDSNELYQKNVVYAVGFVKEDSQPEMLKQLLQLLGNQIGMKIDLRRIDGAVVVGTPATLDRIKEGPSIARPELVGALAVAEDSPLQAFFLPNRLHRRVLSELTPPLPEKMGGAEASKLAGAVQWGALVVDITPDPVLRAIATADSQINAQKIHDLAERAVQFAASQLKSADGDAPEKKQAIARLQQFVSKLVPEVKGSRLEIALNLAKEGDLLTDIIAPSLQAQRASAQQMQSINNLKHFALAMHNYHDVNKHLPAVANFDKQGRPLLSWRVHVLPFLEEGALYKEFHLDEPWDSEHNKQLIKRMPEIFRSPKSRTPKESGLTPYVVPVGEGTMFTGQAKGLHLKDVVDGTTNTIMILQVADSEAVTWTKPDDWQLNLQDIKKGLANPGENVISAAYGDGSVQSLQIDIDPEILKLLLLRGDSQPIPSGY